MKNINNVLLIVILLGFSITSCSEDDDNNNDSSSQEQIQNVVSIANSGSWLISNFNDSGNDETNDFQGYQFTFGDDGVLTASNDNITLTGTWSVTSSSSSSSDDDGSSSDDDDLEFNIFFPVSEDSNFEDLNDDWDISNATNSVIDLFDISGGDGSTDILQFIKI